VLSTSTRLAKGEGALFAQRQSLVASAAGWQCNEVAKKRALRAEQARGDERQSSALCLVKRYRTSILHKPGTYAALGISSVDIVQGRSA